MTNEQQIREFFQEDPQATDELRALSRRRFLTGAVAGGAAGLAVAAGTGVTVWKITDAETQAILTNAEAELARLQGLVDLYENLEAVGLDAILAAGMKALSLPLAAVEAGARALKAGLDWAEQALLALEEALPSAQESILWLENQVSAVASSVDKVEQAIGQALDRVTDNAAAEALEDFANMILDSLPFGLGDKIRGVLNELVSLLTSVDELIEGINTALLEPLRDKWFGPGDGKSLGAAFITPLVEQILDPLEAHLDDLAELAGTWQQEFLSPTEQAIAERETIRQSISQYKKDHGFL
jgi:hypothetical protein